MPAELLDIALLILGGMTAIGLAISVIVLVGVGVVGFLDWIGYQLDLFRERRSR